MRYLVGIFFKFVCFAAAVAPLAAFAEPAPAKAPVVEFYGFIKVGPILGQDVESFAQPNATAVTAALNPVFGASDGGNRFLTFQAAQTRFGFKTTKEKSVVGQIELDFMDTTKSSPTVASIPRVRIAKVDWSINEQHSLTIGQDWDLFNPVMPHSYNFIGALFTAGNSGFFRQQIQYKAKVGNFELGAAVGLQGNTNGASLGDVEHASTPTFAGRVALNMPHLGRIALNAIGTQLHLGARDTVMYGVGLHGDLWLSKTTNLRFEGYFGQNMNNTGMLTLGTALGRDGTDVREAGGMVSLKQMLGEGRHGLWLSVGVAHVLNPEALSIGYTPGSTNAQTMVVTQPNRVPTNGPGILRNFGTRLGYEFKPVEGLSLFMEGFFYNSNHKLGPAELARFEPGNVGYGGELGAVYYF